MKPCPNCQSTEIRVVPNPWIAHGVHQIACNDCGVCGPFGYNPFGPEEAEEKWDALPRHDVLPDSAVDLIRRWKANGNLNVHPANELIAALVPHFRCIAPEVVATTTTTGTLSSSEPSPQTLPRKLFNVAVEVEDNPAPIDELILSSKYAPVWDIINSKEVKLLLAYSCDTIASYSLVAQYDPKKIAFAIDSLFGQHGTIISMLAAFCEHLPDTVTERKASQSSTFRQAYGGRIGMLIPVAVWDELATIFAKHRQDAPTIHCHCVVCSLVRSCRMAADQTAQEHDVTAQAERDQHPPELHTTVTPTAETLYVDSRPILVERDGVKVPEVQYVIVDAAGAFLRVATPEDMEIVQRNHTTASS